METLLEKHFTETQRTSLEERLKLLARLLTKITPALMRQTGNGFVMEYDKEPTIADTKKLVDALNKIKPSLATNGLTDSFHLHKRVQTVFLSLVGNNPISYALLSNSLDGAIIKALPPHATDIKDRLTRLINILQQDEGVTPGNIHVKTENGIKFHVSLPAHFAPDAAAMLEEALKENGLNYRYYPGHNDLTLLSEPPNSETVKRLDDAIRHIHDERTAGDLVQVNWAARASREDSLTENYLKHLFGDKVTVACHPATKGKPAHITMRTDIRNPLIEQGRERLGTFLRDDQIELHETGNKNVGEYHLKISPMLFEAQTSIHDLDYLRRIASPSAAR